MKHTLFLAALIAIAATAAAQEKPKSKILILPSPVKAGPIATPTAEEKSPAKEAAAPVVPPTTSGPATGDAVPGKLASIFFAQIREGEIDQAYAVLTKGSKIAERPEELRQLKQKTKEAIEVFGAISGHELVENKTVGTRLIRATYISLGKEFPLRWRFYFYKADNAWRLIDLRVDDKLTGVFEESEEAKAAPEPK